MTREEDGEDVDAYLDVHIPPVCSIVDWTGRLCFLQLLLQYS